MSASTPPFFASASASFAFFNPSLRVPSVSFNAFTTGAKSAPSGIVGKMIVVGFLGAAVSAKKRSSDLS